MYFSKPLSIICFLNFQAENFYLSIQSNVTSTIMCFLMYRS